MRGSAQIFKIFSKSEIFIFKSMRGSAQIFQKFEGPLKFFKFCTESENSRVRSNFSNFALLCEGPLKFFKFCSESENSRVRSNFSNFALLCEGPLKFFKFCTESENSRVRSNFSNFALSPKIRGSAQIFQIFQKFEGPLKLYET